MKVDKRYHCFGCSEDGDVINFVAKLFGLGIKEAAEKIASDFDIYAPFNGSHDEVKPAQKSDRQILEDRFNYCWRIYREYLTLLNEWKDQYDPKITDEEWDYRLLEALYRIPQIEHYLDELMEADWPERKKLMDELQNETERITERLANYYQEGSD